MFTGIIREVSQVRDLARAAESMTLTLSRPASFQNMREGDSIAVNGACLTVLEADENSWRVRLMDETLKKTNLGNLNIGDTVNLERPVAAGERFDGHFVLGHVDGATEISEITAVGDDRVMRFTASPSLLPYFIPKGSVALDGVSLTIVDVVADSFTVSFMPYTLEHTTFGQRQVGDTVNVEVDMIAKHVARLVTSSQ